MGIRVLPVHTLAIEQVDFFQGDFFTRIAGLTFSDISVDLFVNNVRESWPLITGAGVTDVQVKAGNIYFNEIAGSPGFYSLRFRPNALGFWRIVVNYAAGVQSIALDYDISAKATTSSGDGGLRLSFIRK